MIGTKSSSTVAENSFLDPSPGTLQLATSRIVSDCFAREKLLEERRTEPRRVLHQMVSVTPLARDDHSYEQVDVPVTAFVRDISVSGVGLLHAHPFASRRLLVCFPMLEGDAISLLVHVKWCCSLGDFGFASGGHAVGVVKPGE